MKNIIIVGNGFDLAHGLATKYSDFIKDIELNPSKYGLINIDLSDNRLLISLNRLNKTYWSDIEYVYFDILTNFNNKSYLQSKYLTVHAYREILQLNQDFDSIKMWLCQYLKEEESKLKRIENYEIFFDKFNNKDTIVLNFNYTNTVNSYINFKINDIKLIHIHGELENERNPIIFGFAAGNEESKELLNKNDNTFVKNIKKFNYLYTRNEEMLKEHLKSEEYNVFILGHSCGISDKLILNQIFNSDGVYKIYPFYFHNRDGYFETMVNIDRIIDDYSKKERDKMTFNKLVSFPNSFKMPQKEIDSNLSIFLNNILNKKLPKEQQRSDQKKKLDSVF
jgi:hypothetical protein